MPAPIRLLTIAMLLVGWRDGSAQTIGEQFVTIVQRDGLAGPVDAPSARVSARGRHVVFASDARLVAQDTNHVRDVYVFDLWTGQLTLESPGVRGTVANGGSSSPGISGDGRYVVFVSSAGNLADTQIPSGMPRVFLRDRETETIRLLATSAIGDPANGYSSNPAISADGTTIVFESAATDLVDGAPAAGTSVGVYLIRQSSGVPVRLNVSSAGEVPAGQSVSPTVSADGRYVAFMSRADLTCVGEPTCPREPPDGNGVVDVYLRDTATNTTTRVSRGHSGRDPDGPSYHPAMSGDGRYVAFVSEASNLTRDASKHAANVYVRDMVTGVTELVSRNPSGRQANGPSVHPAVSHDGSTVAFQSLASDFLCTDRCQTGQRDINLVSDVFVHDRRTRRTIRASADGGEEWMEGSRAPSLDETGRVIVFASRHPLNDHDEAHDEDLYVRRLSHDQSAHEAVALATSQSLLATDSNALARFLEAARPAPVSAEDKARVLNTLPLEGEVTSLNASARQKLAALTQVLRAAGRESVYEIKVIDVPQAAIGLHARAVILISESALTLLGADELQAVVAHEVGHEYVWTERERAFSLADRSRLKDLELMCDGIAIVTLQRLGMDVSRLMSGIQKISRFNRERFGTADNERDYPTLAERQAFARAMAARSAEAIVEVPVELDLRVIVHATLDAADLDRASETFRRLLAPAGFLSRWRDCSGVACSGDPGSVAINVLLLPTTKLTDGDVCGEATRDALTGVRTVLIYVPLIAARVRAIRLRPDGRSNPALATMQTGHLVGAAIAHEVGHALGLRHGARGVMKGRFTVDDALALGTSRLVFTSSESASMRSALRTAQNSVVAAVR